MDLEELDPKKATSPYVCLVLYRIVCFWILWILKLVI